MNAPPESRNLPPRPRTHPGKGLAITLLALIPLVAGFLLGRQTAAFAHPDRQRDVPPAPSAVAAPRTDSPGDVAGRPGPADAPPVEAATGTEDCGASEPCLASAPPAPGRASRPASSRRGPRLR